MLLNLLMKLAKVEKESYKSKIRDTLKEPQVRIGVYSFVSYAPVLLGGLIYSVLYAEMNNNWIVLGLLITLFFLIVNYFTWELILFESKKTIFLSKEHLDKYNKEPKIEPLLSYSDMVFDLATIKIMLMDNKVQEPSYKNFRMPLYSKKELEEIEKIYNESVVDRKILLVDYKYLMKRVCELSESYKLKEEYEEKKAQVKDNLEILKEGVNHEK